MDPISSRESYIVFPPRLLDLNKKMNQFALIPGYTVEDAKVSLNNKKVIVVEHTATWESFKKILLPCTFVLYILATIMVTLLSELVSNKCDFKDTYLANQLSDDIRVDDFLSCSSIEHGVNSLLWACIVPLFFFGNFIFDRYSTELERKKQAKQNEKFEKILKELDCIDTNRNLHGKKISLLFEEGLFPLEEADKLNFQQIQQVLEGKTCFKSISKHISPEQQIPFNKLNLLQKCRVKDLQDAFQSEAMRSMFYNTPGFFEEFLNEFPAEFLDDESVFSNLSDYIQCYLNERFDHCFNDKEIRFILQMFINKGSSSSIKKTIKNFLLKRQDRYFNNLTVNTIATIIFRNGDLDWVAHVCKSNFEMVPIVWNKKKTLFPLTFLAERSNFFKSYSHFKQRKIDADLSEYPQSVYFKFTEYLLGREINITEKEVKHLYCLSDYYDIEHLKEGCTEILEKKYTNASLPKKLRLIKKYPCIVEQMRSMVDSHYTISLEHNGLPEDKRLIDEIKKEIEDFELESAKTSFVKKRILQLEGSIKKEPSIEVLFSTIEEMEKLFPPSSTPNKEIYRVFQNTLRENKETLQGVVENVLESPKPFLVKLLKRFFRTRKNQYHIHSTFLTPDVIVKKLEYVYEKRLI